MIVRGLILAALALLAPSAEAARPRLCGLVLMGDIAFHRSDSGSAETTLAPLDTVPEGLFGGIVINLAWSQVEPAPGQFDTRALDRALDALRDWNRLHPAHPLAARLRVWSGANAPVWVKHLAGAPLPIARGGVAPAITLPHFWDPAVRGAWRAMMARLAARYDREPLIREVTNSSCASLTDEPFVIPSDPASFATLVAAGFTDAAYHECLAQSPRDYAGWHAAAIEWPLGALVRFGSGAAVPDPAATAALAGAFRQTLGRRAILGNHALAPPASLAARGLGPTYALIARLGPPIALQTANPHAPWLEAGRLDWEAAFGTAAHLGAGSVEVWGHSGRDPGFAALAPERLRALADTLAQGRGCDAR